ncbi:monovalent cation/H+ antiporter subunit D family protein [Oceanibacterium hippocampi]|uniref:monovalent cation/H+ antiporter subunit D family protein n=1 Tax=Oceanibacterium hippocampi TaxID=745714 RepID=UPI00111C7854
MAIHYPALQVVLPLLAAPLCSLMRGRDFAWAFATLVSWLAFGIAVALLFAVRADGAISYHLGGWEPPWGIEYRVDALGSYLLAIVTLISAVSLSFARLSVAREVRQDQHALFYTMWLLCLAGMLGIAITGDAFNIFVFLEVSSLSTYALVAMGGGGDRRALTAAYQYLVLGTIGATFILIGIGLIYMMTGTLNILDMSERLPAVADTRTIRVAAGFLTIGIALKLALFPLHVWLPNAYTYAPNAVSAFIAGTSTKVSLYLLLRFSLTVFGPTFSFGKLPLNEILAVLAVAAFLIFSALAILQENVKRLLAYSSIAQVGYMVLGISFASVTGLTAGIVHLFNHALIKTGLFLCVACVAYRIGSVRITAMAGLGRQMPFTMFAFVLGGFGLIGVPLTAGFVTKWYLIMAALEAGTSLGLVAAGLVLVSSLLAVIYVWKVVESAYFRPAPAGSPPVREAPLALLVPTWALILASIYFGIDTRISVGVARDAAVALLGGIS